MSLFLTIIGYYASMVLITFLIGMTYWKVKQEWLHGETVPGTALASVFWPLAILFFGAWGLMNLVMFVTGSLTDHLADRIRQSTVKRIRR